MTNYLTCNVRTVSNSDNCIRGTIRNSFDNSSLQSGGKKRTNQPVVISNLAREIPGEPRGQDPSIEDDTGGRVYEEAVDDNNYIDNIIDVGEQHNKDAGSDEIYENLESHY